MRSTSPGTSPNHLILVQIRRCIFSLYAGLFHVRGQQQVGTDTGTNLTKEEERALGIFPPSCTWLGNYTISDSCGRYLQYEQVGNGSCAVNFGDESNPQGYKWTVAAFATAGIDPTQGNISALFGKDTCPQSVNEGYTLMYTIINDANDTISLMFGEQQAPGPEEAGRGLLRMVALNASNGCSQIRFINSQGKYLQVDDTCESDSLSFISDASNSTIWTVQDIGGYGIVDNHEYDKDVTMAYKDERITFFNLPNGGKPYAINFEKGMIKVGVNDDNRVISFICPQYTAYGFTTEVQIGDVGGAIDPSTLAASIMVENLHWLLWGTIPGLNITLEKENAAMVELNNVTGGSLLTLQNIYAPDASSPVTVGVRGMTGNPASDSTSEQLMFIKAINAGFNNIFTNGSNVFWEANLEGAEPVTGDAYVAFAEARDQGQNVRGTAPDAPVASDVGTTESQPSEAPVARTPVLMGLSFLMLTAML